MEMERLHYEAIDVGLFAGVWNSGGGYRAKSA